MKIIFFIVLFVFSLELEAKESEYTSLTNIFATENVLEFVTEYSDTNVSKCKGGKRFKLDTNNTDYEVQVSALLAAFMANKKIKLIYDEATPQCSGIVKRFWIER